MEEQRDIVRRIQEDIIIKTNELERLQNQLKIEKEKLYSICQHKEYICESDGDYHKVGWYYICRDCGFTTSKRPR